MQTPMGSVTDDTGASAREGNQAQVDGEDGIGDGEDEVSMKVALRSCSDS